MKTEEHYQVIVIGGGQAGLSIGYYLAKAGISFLILDASERVGDSWRRRWDSLRLFTPAKFNTLPGLKFPAHKDSFPNKDEMADYLEQYVKFHNLPVRSGVSVDSLKREGDTYIITAGEYRFECKHAVVAMANYQYPKIPTFAKELDPGIIQIHSHDYKSLSQLQPGEVLVVGAGNSGADLAMEAATSHKVWLAGRDTGHIPFRIESQMAKLVLIYLVIRFIFYRILTTNNFIGRKVRPVIISKGGPLIRHKPKDFAPAGIQRVAKVKKVEGGQPVLETGEKLDVKNIIWCTGYHPRFSWIDLEVFNDQGPIQKRGVVPGEPGLYFLGLHFLFALSSAMVHGSARDARYLVNVIRQRLG